MSLQNPDLCSRSGFCPCPPVGSEGTTPSVVDRLAPSEQQPFSSDALVWAATILGVAIAATASEDFIFELLVLIVGCSLSFGIVNALSAKAHLRDG